ncbi:hypothetical protein [Zhengella mangrovi]|uniref:hypothetical protein n=1 Tax=Zhengella mangrovi TaxID=1982044 RepID=UPI001054AE23|nr:hypothetical protein [Zhengella mangrovi]
MIPSLTDEKKLRWLVSALLNKGFDGEHIYRAILKEFAVDLDMMHHIMMELDPRNDQKSQKSSQPSHIY